MMTIGTDYIPCPQCVAINITCRQHCWQCGALLPYTLLPNGSVRINKDINMDLISHAEIERLLNQAETVRLDREGLGDRAVVKTVASLSTGIGAAKTQPRGFWRNWIRRG